MRRLLIFIQLIIIANCFMYFCTGCAPVIPAKPEETKAPNPAPAKVDSSQTATPDTTKVGCVLVDIANVRREPKLNSGIVCKVKKGQAVILNALQGQWWKVTVNAADSIGGYIYAELIDSRCFEPPSEYDQVELFKARIKKPNPDLFKQLVVEAVYCEGAQMKIFVSKYWGYLSHWDQEALALFWRKTWVQVLLDKPIDWQKPSIGPDGTLVAIVVVNYYGFIVAACHYDWHLRDDVVDFDDDPLHPDK